MISRLLLTIRVIK